MGSAQASIRSTSDPRSAIASTGVIMRIISGAAMYITTAINVMMSMPEKVVR